MTERKKLPINEHIAKLESEIESGKDEDGNDLTDDVRAAKVKKLARIKRTNRSNG